MNEMFLLKMVISRITGKFFVIFIFKFSEITFCKLINDPYLRIIKQNCRCLKAPLKWTYKYRLRLWICKLSEQFPEIGRAHV